MKKLILISMLFAGLTSCKKWLEISPKSQISANKLFESEQGFKDALIGNYLLMTNTSTYGFENNVGFVDALGQQYYIATSSNPYYYASLYQYDQLTVVPKIENIWAGNYNVIANLNNLIENIDQKKSMLHPANYAFIKGESVGLRAFLHFDLLRLFGYGNLANDPSKLTTKILPYVTKYSKAKTIPVTISDYIDSLKKDLNTAEALLAPYDSITLKKNTLEIPNTDLFYNDRRGRFNYFAVKATQARLYLWTGEYDKAIAAANKVITGGMQNLVTFHSGNINDPNPVNKDYTFSTEHVFSLNVQNLYDIVKPFIQQYALDGININYSRLNHNGTVANNLYETATKPNMSLSDYRYKELYNKVSTTDFLLLKFTYVTNSTFKDRMPIIKLPEMFYVLAEANNETGNQANAVNYLNTVRINRGISSSYNLTTNISKDSVTNEIEKEYRKEFVSEGQLFYYYKRRGKAGIPGTSKFMDNSVYVLPLPQKELEMGGQ
ncbi:RagB/SusD family nutrient uptake outer membrane protein [Pinibacter soli]|uniref:RagB/SusD family nutrient uptake outer membrane protein n=1 Tax=Pinibacter soli TaxID=3044211 RepID=A0ABT6RFV4_9BACT|nr:RagB/SusD family nutrient uptake outer membrane protein [Pinibacter soli]MDI3321447.1 RagB/SusD family nutrient uptake outer membrane protein [Pinibacter soli]